MPNNFEELSSLLERASEEQRDALGEIIGAPFGNSTSLLCDHLCYLRAGQFRQAFDTRDYKQLVTDVADRVNIDWTPLIQGTSWEKLSSEQIEAEIVHRVNDCLQSAINEENQVRGFVNDALQIMSGETSLFAGVDKSIADSINHVFSHVSKNWRKLTLALLYIHLVIRPSTSRI